MLKRLSFWEINAFVDENRVRIYSDGTIWVFKEIAGEFLVKKRNTKNLSSEKRSLTEQIFPGKEVEVTNEIWMRRRAKPVWKLNKPSAGRYSS